MVFLHICLKSGKSKKMTSFKKKSSNFGHYSSSHDKKKENCTLEIIEKSENYDLLNDKNS